MKSNHMLLHNSSKYCWAWNRVYVKANGRVPCWCDSGEQHTITHKRFDKVDFIDEIVNSKEMREMRNDILFASDYYIKQCRTCCCMIDNQRGKHFRFSDKEQPNFEPAQKTNKAVEIIQRVHNKRGWPIGSIDRIAEIQLEPSFPCNLKCPGCLQGYHENPLKTEIGPYVFPYDWFKMMIKSILDHHVKLDRIAFVGRGEPTLNNEYPNMISHARSEIPNIIMSMDTNSNQPFKKEYLQLNWINCSIDGSDQESYGRYRRGGTFTKAIEFMHNGADLKKTHGSKCKIRWKYILFNTNDSDEQLNKAQKLALDIGIDELDFVITHCGSHDRSITPSTRFTTLEQLNTYLRANKIFQMAFGSRAT